MADESVSVPLLSAPFVSVPFRMAVSTLRAYLEVPVVDDPHYSSIELQWLEADGVEGYTVLLTGQEPTSQEVTGQEPTSQQKVIDVYVDTCLGLGDDWFTTDPALSNVHQGVLSQRDFSGDGVDANVDTVVTRDRIHASFHLIDRHGRSVSVEVTTDPRAGAPGGSYVIPTPPREPRLYQLPFLMNRDFWLMARTSTSITVSIDGERRETMPLWLPLAFRRRLLARYASGVSMVGLNPAGADLAPIRITDPDPDAARAPGAGSAAGAPNAADTGSAAGADQAGDLTVAQPADLVAELAAEPSTRFLLRRLHGPADKEQLSQKQLSQEQLSQEQLSQVALAEVSSAGALDDLRMIFDPPMELGIRDSNRQPSENSSSDTSHSHSNSGSDTNAASSDDHGLGLGLGPVPGREGVVRFVHGTELSGTARYVVSGDAESTTVELLDVRQHWPVSIRRFGVFGLTVVRRLNRRGFYRWSCTTRNVAGGLPTATAAWFDRQA